MQERSTPGTRVWLIWFAANALGGALVLAVWWHETFWPAVLDQWTVAAVMPPVGLLPQWLALRYLGAKSKWWLPASWAFAAVGATLGGLVGLAGLLALQHLSFASQLPWLSAAVPAAVMTGTAITVMGAMQAEVLEPARRARRAWVGGHMLSGLLLGPALVGPIAWLAVHGEFPIHTPWPAVLMGLAGGSVYALLTGGPLTRALNGPWGISKFHRNRLRQALVAVTAATLLLDVPIGVVVDVWGGSLPRIDRMDARSIADYAQVQLPASARNVHTYRQYEWDGSHGVIRFEIAEADLPQLLSTSGTAARPGQPMPRLSLRPGYNPFDCQEATIRGVSDGRLAQRQYVCNGQFDNLSWFSSAPASVQRWLEDDREDGALVGGDGSANRMYVAYRLESGDVAVDLVVQR